MEEAVKQQNNRRSFFNLKIAAFFLFFGNLLYLLFILVIAYNNIPQSDDYCFMVANKHYGFFGSIRWWYNNWQGRFMPYVCINFFLLIYEKIGSLFPYTLFITFVYVFSIYHLLVKIINPERSKWSRFFIAGLSLTIFNSLLLFHFDTSTFFWINVSTMYFGGVGFFLLGVNQVFAKSRSLISYAVLIFSFLYAGSSSEHFGLISLILLGIILGAVFFSKEILAGGKRKKIIVTKLWISLLVCVLAFLILYIAPGNNVRRSFFPHLSIMNSVKHTASAINYLVFLVIPSRLSYLFIVLFSFIFAGAYFGHKTNKENISTKLSILFCFVLVGVIILTQFLFIYALSYSGPSRAYIHLSILFVIAAAGLGFLIGGEANAVSAVHYLVTYTGSLMIVLVSLYQIKSSLYPTLNYAKSVNERLGLLKRMKNSNYQGVFKLDSLKISSRNFLINSEIAKNPLDSNSMVINNCIGEVLDLKFKMELKDR